MSDKWTTLPSKKTIDTTMASLKTNGITPIFAKTGKEAYEEFFKLVPEGSEVFNVTSVTLDSLGISKEINESGKYDAIRPKLLAMDRATQGEDMRKIGAAPAYVAGSVHALTQDGHAMIASMGGSQLPAYAYGAGKVIWVVGAQKIVKNEIEGRKRLYNHTLPLESERANAAYHMTMGSSVNKLLTIYKEVIPQRITVIIVNEVLGF